MSFNLRDELASRLFVQFMSQDAVEFESVNPRPLARKTELAQRCLHVAQDFCETVCSERGHDFALHHWLEGTQPSAQGRNSGAPRGMYECSRCGKQEERSSK
jgi:hypothetical protein